MLKTNNGTHLLYENAVQLTEGHSNAIISRERKMKINFACSFDLDIALSLSNRILPTLNHFDVNVGMKSGSFGVSMKLYSDNSFTTPLSSSSIIMEVPAKMYVAVQIDNPSPTDFKIKLKRCWATPS